MARSYLLWGPEGTWKTSFALEDACPESPASYHELEAGGFTRATKRRKFPEGSIFVHKHQQPFNNLEQIGQVIRTSGGNAMPQLKYHLEGWVEMASGFINDYTADIKAGKRPVVDTATRCWPMLRNFYYELVQDIGADADKLGQLKYSEPKSIHASLLEFPKAYDIDSVWIAHQKQEYDSDPVKYIPDCWEEVANNIDVSLRFRLSGTTGIATIQKGGEAGMLVGLDISEPTLKKVNAIIDVYMAMMAEGEPVERDADVLLMEAKMRGLYA